ncbi:hypothetical protein B0A55_10448 [Friedmanniomyces simplex]|uniref:Protein YAE1 n=1 Tax=Friedmanniomyces simplex TaxID=329884 RepID=A0A4U0WIW5_9PEZI|nr:hypothetical protein B0A55_10448 [Friedmanniomyces simplex]
MLRDLPPFAHDDGHDFMMTSPPGDEETHETHFDPLDDVFGSAPASPVRSGDNEGTNGHRTGPSSGLDHSDITRLRNTHVTNGYREGITTSKEKYMQDGFDEGYSLGAELGLKAGWCLGALEGMWRALPLEHVGQIGDGNGGGDPKIGRVELAALVETAKLELEISQLCGKDYFGEDGLWLYDVSEKEGGEHGIAFEDVAAAHPLLRKWTDKVLGLSAQLGLQLAQSSYKRTIARLSPRQQVMGRARKGKNSMATAFAGPSGASDTQGDTSPAPKSVKIPHQLRSPSDADEGSAMAYDPDAEDSAGSNIIVASARNVSDGDEDGDDNEGSDSAGSNIVVASRTSNPTWMMSATPAPLSVSSSSGETTSSSPEVALARHRKKLGKTATKAPARPALSASTSRQARQAPLPKRTVKRIFVPDSESDSELSDRSATPPTPELPRTSKRSIEETATSASQSDSELSDRSATPATPPLPQHVGRTIRRPMIPDRKSDTELSLRSATPPRPPVVCRCTTWCTCAKHAYLDRGFAASARHLGEWTLVEMAKGDAVSAVRELLPRGRETGESRSGEFAEYRKGSQDQA